MISWYVLVIDNASHPVSKITLHRPRRNAWGLTCSSSCLSLCSCDSSCLLWSSRICILASRRPLCWRSSLASAMSSASRGLCGETGIISGGDGSGDRPLWSCCCFRRSYSACRFLVGSDKGAKALFMAPAWGSDQTPPLLSLLISPTCTSCLSLSWIHTSVGLLPADPQELVSDGSVIQVA